MLSRIITSAIISSRILKIKDELTDRTVRPTLNIFITKPFGFGFSTSFLQLEERGYVNYINDFSAPGLVGTVKGGKIYMGSLVESGYKLTIIDEVMKLDNKAKKIILELTEHGRATRSIQGFVEKRIERNIVGGKYVVNDSKITLEVHTSYVFGTASDQIYQDPDLKMLLSRCFCLNLTMDVEDAILLKKKGRELIVNEEIIPDEPIDLVVLPSDVNEYLIDKMTENLIVGKSEGGYFTRAHDDMIRLSAVHCVARGDTTIGEKDVKYALEFFKLHQLGYMGVLLPENAITIYNYCKGLTIKELVEKTGLAERTIRKHLRKLMEANLVAKVGDKYFRV